MSGREKRLVHGTIADIPVPERPEDERLVEETVREALTVKVEDGVEYDAESLKAQKWIEGRFDSPSTLYDENVDHTYWQGLAGYMKAIVRRTSAPALRECREVAWRFAKVLQKERLKVITPMKSQLELNDCLVEAMCSNVSTMREFVEAKNRISETLRFWHESNYKYWNERFMGRRVG